MEKYWNFVQDEQGNTLSNATIQVVDFVTGQNVGIFSDNGVTSTTNPLTSDNSGYFEFYAPNGRYNLIVSHNAFSNEIINDVLIFDIADSQVHGFGTPTGNLIINNFPGSSATLAQTSATVAEILLILRNLGVIGT